MQCSNCGAAVAADSRFCNTCGSEMKGYHAGRSTSADNVKAGELIYTAYKHREAGAVDDAILACQGALALNEESAQAHSLLGSLYELKGDIESALHEYESAVQIDSGSVSDLQKLISLKHGPASLSPAAGSGDMLDVLRPYTPLLASVVTICLVLVLGFAILRSSAGKPAGKDGRPDASAPMGTQPTGPTQPYGQQYPQGQYYQPYPNQAQPQQSQTTAQAPSVTPPRQSIPSVPLPRVQPSTNGHTMPIQPVGRPTNESPVIVPVIEPPHNTSTSSSSGTAGEPVIHYTSSPTTPNANPEQSGLQLQRAGKYREAIASYRQALNKAGDPGHTHQQIALCYQRLGEDDMAVDSYNRAISAYREQLKAGRNAAEVQRDIRACEAGIQVSRSQGR